MIEHSVTLINKLGLHARAANKLLDTTGRYQSSVHITFNGKKADGKSIMSVMLLAAPVGSELTIVTDGKDEQESMQAIIDLINNRFGESE